MKKTVSLLLFVFIFPLFAEFEHSGVIINVPTAQFPTGQGAEIGTFFHLPIRNEAVPNFKFEKPFDYDLYVSKTFSNWFLSLKMYTLREWALDIVYKVMEEIANTPAIAMGIADITYKKYVSSTGGEPPDGGYKDDNSYYWNPDDGFNTDTRTFENLSLFLVVSKHFGYRFIGTMGLGRGKFVGYGPRSKNFNLDVFSGVKHQWTFGIFWGATYYVSDKVVLLLDFDGRDFNFGIRYAAPFLSVNLGFLKMEHILWGSPSFSPRIGIGVDINTEIFAKE